MADHGPIPKRSEERRRRNKPDVPSETVTVAGTVPVPATDPTWHPIARDWYDSLGPSGQGKFYEPSDWATAQYAAELMSRLLNQDDVSAALVSGLNSLLSALLVTEGARRRVGIEIDRKPKKPAVVRSLADYRDPFAG